MSCHGECCGNALTSLALDSRNAGRACHCAPQVLHHGAPVGNALWEYDGWGPGYAHGGIYHEHAPDTEWVRM